jgi:hypothetical protein
VILARGVSSAYNSHSERPVDLALSSHASEIVVRHCIGALLLGTVGALLAARWPRTRWASVAIVLLWFAPTAWHFLPSATRTSQQNLVIFGELAAMILTGAVASALPFLISRRTRSRSAA